MAVFKRLCVSMWCIAYSRAIARLAALAICTDTYTIEELGGAIRMTWAIGDTTIELISDSDTVRNHCDKLISESDIAISEATLWSQQATYGDDEHFLLIHKTTININYSIIWIVLIMYNVVHTSRYSQIRLHIIDRYDHIWWWCVDIWSIWWCMRTRWRVCTLVHTQHEVGDDGRVMCDSISTTMMIVRMYEYLSHVTYHDRSIDTHTCTWCQIVVRTWQWSRIFAYGVRALRARCASIDEIRTDTIDRH